MPKERENKYKHNYRGKYETPLERMRNYLSRTFCLISILNDEKAIDMDITQLKKDAHADLDTIRDLLDDMSVDYAELENYRENIIPDYDENI